MIDNCIFNKSDFTLCNVPVPKGYPQSQTHSGIALYKDSYILTTSPFPSIKRNIWIARLRQAIYILSFKKIFSGKRDEYYENPLIYKGTQNSEPPTNFKLMQERPLMECPDAYYGLPAFNSDPDLFIEGDTVNILNRAIYRTKLCPGETLNKYYIRLFLIQGIVDGEKFKFYKNELLKENEKIFVSPCFLKYKNRYLLTYLDTVAYIDGKTFDGLYYVTADTIDGIRSNENWIKVEVNVLGYLPWHMSIFEYRGVLYTIIACVEEGIGHRCWQMLGVFSNDLSTLKIFKTPLTDYASYRGAALVRDDGEFILYNTTVHEKIKGGKSVDGREVMMAHMPFEELLSKLKENE